MTTEEFNNKWSASIPKGWYAMAISDSEVIAYVDSVLEEYAPCREIEIHQIKLKFGMARFYVQGLEDIQLEVEKNINRILDNK